MISRSVPFHPNRKPKCKMVRMPVRWLKRVVKGSLIRTVKPLGALLGMQLMDGHGRYSQDGLFTIHNDYFRTEAAFRKAYARGVKASAGFDPQFEWRVHVALWAGRTALQAEGDFVECGVNAG